MWRLEGKKTYITGINGLRSIAVLGVLIYHLLPKYLPGGYLGVPLFFVISGYLMTNILLNQWGRSHKVSLGSFYKKRMKRIYPSLLIVLLLFGNWAMFYSKAFLLNFREVVATSLLNINNWWQMSSGSSYFDRFGNESFFTHLWSLSIEGQFYLIWPIVFAFVMYKQEDTKRLKHVVLFLGGISALLMGLLYQPDMIDRVYYGTDTRLFSIMFGSWLAIELREKNKIYHLMVARDKAVGLVSLVLLGASYYFVTDTAKMTYFGGMFVFSGIATLLLGTIIVSKDMNRLFTNPLFDWIGTRSYEIYLWQYPVIVAYEKITGWNGQNVWLHLLLQLTLILILSELTYRIVTKMSRSSLKDVFSTIKEKKLIMGVCVLIMLGFSGSLVMATSGKTEASQNLENKLKENKKKLEEGPTQATSEVKGSSTTEESGTVESTSETTIALTEETIEPNPIIAPLKEKEKEQAKSIKLGAIGDSLLLSAAPEIQTVFPNSKIDAEVGRQLMDSLEVFKKAEKKEQLGDVVLVVLGTNGSFEKKDIDEIMAVIGDRPVFFMNTMVNRPWQTSVNKELDNTAKRYDNAHLIDWKSISEGQTTWFEEDGIHVNIEGSEAFTSLVTREILKEVK